ncbi:MAG: UPF0164 family protein, partial [Elusimicrobia bacterium]|nr:UPF0164 family protein [Elusimicrobiota bacterium]
MSPIVAAIAAIWGFVFTGGSFAKEGGGAAGQFLNYGAGARALGMGGAFYSISDDASAPAWNPAGLAYVQKKEVTMMQATLFAQTKYNYIGYVHPKTAGGTFGVSMTQLQSTGFEKVEAKFNPATGEPTSVQTAGSFADMQSAMGVSWGKLVTDSMAFGTSIKQVKRQLDSSTDSNLSLDIGFMK